VRDPDAPRGRTRRRLRRAIALAGVLAAVVVVVLAYALVTRPVRPPSRHAGPSPQATPSTGAPGRPPPSGCRNAGPLLGIAGVQESRLHRGELPPDTVVDARSARWVGPTRFPVELGGGSGVCLAGGVIRGTFPSERSWSFMHGTAAVIVSSPDAVIDGVRIDNYGDGVRLVRNAKDFTLRRSHLSHLRDDCVENDSLFGGSVDDTLLDGCYSAFSSRPYDGLRADLDGRDNTVTITNTLVRLQPMDRVYRNRGLVPGHDGFFKWDERSPLLSLHHDVFRADQPANNVGLGVPDGKVASCSDNVMVWLGRGPFPDALPDCFRVTRDKRVWDRAVDEWRRRHPDLR
jgi:hypothetical protein